jgi:hypothetical protein
MSGYDDDVTNKDEYKLLNENQKLFKSKNKVKRNNNNILDNDK